MGVLYGHYDLLDSLTAYKVRPLPKDPPGKFETGTGNFEGMCGCSVPEYIEWAGKTYGEENGNVMHATTPDGVCDLTRDAALRS